MSDAIHQIVTERMIAALQSGTIPWRRPWQAATGAPRSLSTGAQYRGINIFLLALTACDKGYRSPHWGTYRQIAALGGQVRRGEKSTLVIFWKPAQPQHAAQHGQATREPGEPEPGRPPVLRYYRVFNAGQADLLPDQFYAPAASDEQIREPQAVLDSYLHGGPVLHHGAGDRAAYHPGTDTIWLPLRAQFATPALYYATAFHEAGHSTGHRSRLNRPGITAFDHFGSGRYAREELTAEMTSSILCAQTGIDSPQLFANSAAYIAGWLTALDGDHRLVSTAAAHAQKASDLIAQAEPELVPAQPTEPRAPSAGASRAQPARIPATEPAARALATPGRAVAAVNRVSGLPGTEPSHLASLRPAFTAHRPSDKNGPQHSHAKTPASDWQAEAG